MAFPLWVPFENEWWTFSILFLIIFTFIMLSNLILRMRLIHPDKIRRIIHLMVGMLTLITPMIFTNYKQPSLLAIIFIILNIIAFKTKQFKGIHSQDRITYGTIFFPFSFFLLVTAFWNYPELIIISLSILTFADPIAAQIGESSNSPSNYTIWYDKKSIQGTLAFFICTFVIIYSTSEILFNFSMIYGLLFAIFVSIGATISEITSCKGSDNFSIPIVSILFMICFFELIPPSSQNFLDIIFDKRIIIILIIIFVFTISYFFKSLTLSGFFGGIIMGIIIFTLGSYLYLIPITAFFLLSSLLGKLLNYTSLYRIKETGRNIIQVYSNGGVGLVLCIINYFHPDPIYLLLFLSSIAAAMSDTWGTEFGKLSNNKPVSILNLKTMEHGLSGGITQIGTIGSLLGSCIIGLIVWLLNFTSTFSIYIIIITGFIAALLDSVLGASIQAKYETVNGDIIEKKEPNAKLISGKKWMTNDMVNLTNTIIAPLVMYAIILIFQ